MIKPTYPRDFLDTASNRLRALYPDADNRHLIERLQLAMGRYGINLDPGQESINQEMWSEKDAVLITYADTLLGGENQVPLQQLTRFATDHLRSAFNTIHLLPFFPWSSDDGFSVINYRQVDESSGTWADVAGLRNHFNLMFDWVLNHVSAKSSWFRFYINGVSPYRDFFIEESPETDLSEVTRPRTSPLLTQVETRHGTRHVWTTFSADQVDLNWANPDVFFEMLDVLLFYISQGASIIRMDAVAFLWKEVGTTCLHHEMTHEVIRFLRNILDQIAPNVILLTETNVPHKENISYFGQADEAHMVYQFSLPPLTLHALLREDADHLTSWAQSLPSLPDSCTFFNFTSSHDGIGVRPLQGILDDDELDFLVESIQNRGGRVSYRTLPDGSQSPYELNCTWFSALADPDDPLSEISARRFLASQIIAMSLQGIPGIYIHSILASPNDLEGVEESGINRRINRHKLTPDELDDFLKDVDHSRNQIFKEYLRILAVRNTEPAFHPNVAQNIINGHQKAFIVKRCAENPVICLHNISVSQIDVDLGSHLTPGKWIDLLGGIEREFSNTSVNMNPLECLWLKKLPQGS